ncbi:MAG: M20/M25/M40 family metallo-hydrolase [Anaerolineales bacterium]|nr:M20/M25/M40 family metallo-hydrolase [Anaerolineales bacterium]
MQNKIWFDEVLQLTKTLMGIASISPNIEDENKCVDVIRDLTLSNYENGKTPDVFSEFWFTEDGRKNFACLLKSKKKSYKTIILMGHFDTVGVDDFARYGDVNIAFHPEQLAEEMKKYFQSKNDLDISEQSAWTHLQSGDWLFGRGCVDMKSGVAINIAILRAFAKPDENGKRLIDELDGNILLLACPDEETESVGVLSAVPNLLKLREKEKLNYIGVINTDYTAPRNENENIRFIYSGTVGKLLPSFYILGVRTHVGEIFRGVDASHIAAELVSEINLNPAWMDKWTGKLGDEQLTEIAVPPVALQMRDLKPLYNAETAGDAFVYVNWLTLQITPLEAMKKMKDSAKQALGQVMKRVEESYTEFNKLGGQSQTPPEWNELVISYDELLQKASKEFGDNLGQWMKNKVVEFSSQAKDSREISCLLVVELTKLAKLNGPAIVTFFSPPYYPSVLPQENELTQAAASVISEFDDELQFRGFFPYISDLSYMRLDNADASESLKKFMPLFDFEKNDETKVYLLDSNKLNEIQALNCPVINIGPFGRDAHGLYERVYMPYSFETVPQIIFQTIKRALGK